MQGLDGQQGLNKPITEQGGVTVQKRSTTQAPADGHSSVGVSPDRTRQRVLQALLSSSTPLSVAEVGERIAMHPNTVRFHLDHLQADELVAASADPAVKRGRPRMLYSATPKAFASGPDDGLLVDVLLNQFAVDHGRELARSARDAGRRWVASSSAPVTPGRALSAAEQLDALQAALDDWGYVPSRRSQHDNRSGEGTGQTADAQPADVEPVAARATADGPATQAASARIRETLELHHCPMAERADQSPEVVCSMHAGMVCGLLEQVGGHWQLDEFTPHAGPGICTVSCAVAGQHGLSPEQSVAQQSS